MRGVIDSEKIPAGMVYQYCTHSLLGDESFSEIAKRETAGWRKVPRSRHPELKSQHPVFILDGGQFLMERPKYINEREAEYQHMRADAAVVSAAAGLTNAVRRSSHVFGDGPDEAFVARVNNRDVNLMAPAIIARGRRKNVKEFVILNGWRGYSWIRDKVMGRR